MVTASPAVDDRAAPKIEPARWGQTGEHPHAQVGRSVTICVQDRRRSLATLLVGRFESLEIPRVRRGQPPTGNATLTA